MKSIFLIRHAKSSWANPNLRDVERPLNNRGLRDAPFMAKLLLAKASTIQKFISSPAKRALMTATYFAEAFNQSKADIVIEEKIYEAYVEDILELIQDLPEDWQEVALFGHNPTFTSLGNRFSKEYIPNVPTCGILKLQSSVESWKNFDVGNTHLAAFYYPKQYFT